MALYVCFDDSISDPTYTSLDGAMVVDGPPGAPNPCAHAQHLDNAPICPTTAAEAERLARLFGWDFQESNGVVTLSFKV
jgi:hypothetical protein